METTAQKLRARAKPVGPDLEALLGCSGPDSAYGEEETKGTSSGLQMTPKWDVFGVGSAGSNSLQGGPCVTGD